MSPKLSERALIARINRKLAYENQRLRKTRGRSWNWVNFGTFYIINFYLNTIVAQHVDIFKLACELEIVVGGDGCVPDNPS